MGEVYRARDTKLDRDVALKVLPESFAADRDRVARFQREAKTLASLNHPNIGQIYGLEDADGVVALVLELVEGPTLADRIARGAIALNGSVDRKVHTPPRITAYGSSTEPLATRPWRRSFAAGSQASAGFLRLRDA